jgi:hypothetical protein
VSSSNNEGVECGEVCIEAGDRLCLIIRAFGINIHIMSLSINLESKFTIIDINIQTVSDVPQ